MDERSGSDRQTKCNISPNNEFNTYKNPCPVATRILVLDSHTAYSLVRTSHVSGVGGVLEFRHEIGMLPFQETHEEKECIYTASSLITILRSILSVFKDSIAVFSPAHPLQCIHETRL